MDTKETAKAPGPIFRLLNFDLANPSLGDPLSVPLHQSIRLQPFNTPSGHLTQGFQLRHGVFQLMHFFELPFSTAVYSLEKLKLNIVLCLEQSRWRFQQVSLHGFTRLGGTYTKLITVSVHPKCSGLPGAVMPALLLVHLSLTALPAAGATKPCGRAHEEGRQEEHPLNTEPSARRVLCMEWHYSLTMWRNHISMYPIATISSGSYRTSCCQHWRPVYGCCDKHLRKDLW